MLIGGIDVSASGHLSGAHVNAAVTIRLHAHAAFPLRDAVACVGAQLAGVTGGAFALFGGRAGGGAGRRNANSLGSRHAARNKKPAVEQILRVK
jgi:glycerol uptake facilitator-like aquaporin